MQILGTRAMCPLSGLSPAQDPGARSTERTWRAEIWSRGPSASLHRPRRREGGSGEGATQTVALSELRPQFSQVCPSEGDAMGARLRSLPPLAVFTRSSPALAAGPGSRPATKVEQGAGADAGSEGRGARVLRRVHTMRRRARTPSSRPRNGISLRRLDAGTRGPREAPAESEHQLSNRG